MLTARLSTCSRSRSPRDDGDEAGRQGDFFYVCERGVFDVYVSGADGTQNKVHTYAVTDGNHLALASWR